MNKKPSKFEETFGRLKIENLKTSESWKVFQLKDRPLTELKDKIYPICKFTPFDMIKMQQLDVVTPFEDLENFRRIKKELVFIQKGVLELFEKKVDYKKYFYTINDFRTKTWYERNTLIEQKEYPNHENQSSILKNLLEEYLVTKNKFIIEEFLIDFNVNQPSNVMGCKWTSIPSGNSTIVYGYYFHTNNPEVEKWYLPMIYVWDQSDPLIEYKGIKQFGDYIQWNVLQYVWYDKRFGEEIIELLLKFGADPDESDICNIALNDITIDERYNYIFSPLKFLNVKKMKQHQNISIHFE